MDHPRLLAIVSALMSPPIRTGIESGKPLLIEMRIFAGKVTIRAYDPTYTEFELPVGN